MKLELYTLGEPHGDNLEEWIHVARTAEDMYKTEHIETWGDVLALCSPDTKVFPCAGDFKGITEHQYNLIRLNYALDYLPWRYHADLLVLVWDLLEDNGELQIIGRDLARILSRFVKGPLKRRLAGDHEELLQQLYSSGAAYDYFKSALILPRIKWQLRSAGFSRINMRHTGLYEVTIMARKIEVWTL